jgi:hypothetical protein
MALLRKVTQLQFCVSGVWLLVEAVMWGLVEHQQEQDLQHAGQHEVSSP